MIAMSDLQRSFLGAVNANLPAVSKQRQNYFADHPEALTEVLCQLSSFAGLEFGSVASGDLGNKNPFHYLEKNNVRVNPQTREVIKGLELTELDRMIYKPFVIPEAFWADSDLNYQEREERALVEAITDEQNSIISGPLYDTPPAQLTLFFAADLTPRNFAEFAKFGITRITMMHTPIRTAGKQLRLSIHESGGELIICHHDWKNSRGFAFV